MSDCDWLGMDVFGTQVLAPGPSELPSTVLQSKPLGIDQIVTVAQAANGAFTTIPRDASNPLSLPFTRLKKNRPLLVALHVTGRVTTGFATASDLTFRVRATASSDVPTRPGDANNLLLTRTVRVDLTPATLQPNFTLGMTVLVPPEVLPDTADLTFVAQFKLQATGTAGASLTFDPKQDALVVQEIGPFTL